MGINWTAFLARLRAYPSHYHSILPPCADDRISAVEKELGPIPPTVREMLKQFNGAQLFESGLPFVHLFGLSPIPALPPMEWAPDFWIDKFTPKWRGTGPNRESDWAIAMTNYGGLILLDADGKIKQWDTSQGCWDSKGIAFADWIEQIIEEGEEVMEDVG